MSLLDDQARQPYIAPHETSTQQHDQNSTTAALTAALRAVPLLEKPRKPAVQHPPNDARPALLQTPDGKGENGPHKITSPLHGLHSDETNYGIDPDDDQAMNDLYDSAFERINQAQAIDVTPPNNPGHGQRIDQQRPASLQCYIELLDSAVTRKRCRQLVWQYLTLLGCNLP